MVRGGAMHSETCHGAPGPRSPDQRLSRSVHSLTHGVAELLPSVDVVDCRVEHTRNRPHNAAARSGRLESGQPILDHSWRQPVPEPR